MNVLTALGFSWLIGAPIVASAIFARETRTGSIAVIDENPQQEEVTFP